MAKIDLTSTKVTLDPKLEVFEPSKEDLKLIPRTTLITLPQPYNLKKYKFKYSF